MAITLLMFRVEENGLPVLQTLEKYYGGGIAPVRSWAFWKPRRYTWSLLTHSPNDVRLEVRSHAANAKIRITEIR